MAQMFVNPLEDSGFKILFRKKRNMVGFLETVLERKIDDLEYIDTEQLGVTIDENKARFDLAVKFADGTTCVVEMQRACLQYFNYRAVFYASHLVQRQATEEHDRQFESSRKNRERPCWNYYFCPVYFVGILENGWGDFKTDEGPVLERFRLKEISTGTDMNVDYNFVFLRLDRFAKAEQDCVTPLDQFAYSLKNMGKEELIPDTFRNETMMNLYDDALIANLTPDIAHELIRSGIMTTENDWLVAIKEARERAIKEGLKEGREEGREEGLKEGRKKGREEGREEGRKEGIKSVVTNMKSAGMSMEQIASLTGMTIEAIEKL